MSLGRLLTSLLLCIVVSACGSETRDEPLPADPGADPVVVESPPVTQAEPEPDPRVPAGAEAARVDAAERIVGFLRGELDFDGTLFADTVALHVPPEGGGAARRVAGQRLRERSEWRVGEHSFLPFAGPASLTTRVDAHFTCFEQPLAERSAELARLPHVGTMLAPPQPGSCLQSWNLTLVFAPEASPPRLVAALYDQWEW